MHCEELLLPQKVCRPFLNVTSKKDSACLLLYFQFLKANVQLCGRVCAAPAVKVREPATNLVAQRHFGTTKIGAQNDTRYHILCQLRYAIVRGCLYGDIVLVDNN